MNALPANVSSSTSSHLSPSASTSISTSSPGSDSLEQLVQAVGEEVVRAYRDKYIPFQVLQACPTIYSYENAPKWLNFDKFAYFVAQYYQERSLPPSPRPITSSSADAAIPIGINLQTDPSVGTSSAPISYTYSEASPYTDAVCTPGDTTSLVPRKRPHFSNIDEDRDATATEVILDYRHPEESQNPLLKRNSTKQAMYSAAGYIQLTRQSWVNRIEYFKEIPLHWRVPASGDSVAYLLDLSDNPAAHVSERTKRTTMSALIKQKCTDAWSGGTGGSLTKATTVPLLGPGVKCQKMAHDCRGVFLCSRVDPELWKDYNREDRDENSEYPLFATGNAVDGEEPGCLSELDRSRFERAVRFYNTMVKERCFGENGNCSGKPEYKSYDAIFPKSQHAACISCSASLPYGPNEGHFYHEIPSDVDHTLLIKLFAMRRTNLSDTIVFNRSCTFTVPPRTGNKQKYCPHIHVENGDIFEATMWQRPCPAKITIMSPIDHEIRKAVIVPAVIPHNHPFCPWDKRTRKAKAAERMMHNGSEDGSGDMGAEGDFDDEAA